MVLLDTALSTEKNNRVWEECCLRLAIARTKKNCTHLYHCCRYKLCSKKIEYVNVEDKVGKTLMNNVVQTTTIDNVLTSNLIQNEDDIILKCSADLIYEQVELSTVSITPTITVGEEIVPSHSQVTALVEDNMVFEMNVDRHESLNVYDVEPAALDNDTCSDSDSASFTDQELEANNIWTKNLQKTEFSFRLEIVEWQLLRQSQQNHLFKNLDWINIMTKNLKKFIPYCCLCFLWHRVKKVDSIRREGYLFNAQGYCKFTGCPITFKISISDEDLLDAHVKFSGITCIHRLSEIMARPIRASKRGKIASSMKNIIPRQKHLDCIKELCPEVRAAGNRDDAPSVAVLSQIVCQYNKTKRKHPNEMESLRLLKEDFEKQHQSYACLQYIFTEPPSVMIWSKESLKILHQRCIDDVVYIDATGSIVKKRKHPFHIYEMVVRSSMKGGSPFPVATYLTNLHSTASILSFLNFLYSDYCKLFGKSSRVSPRCLSHIMKNAKVLCLKNIPKNFTFAMHLFGQVANVTMINALNSILISMEGVFGSEFEGLQVTQYLLQLQQAINDNEFDLEENGATATTELAETEDDVCQPGSFMKACENNMALAKITDTGIKKNMYYSPEFLSSFKKDLLPSALLWTNLLTGNLGRHGTSDNYKNQNAIYLELILKDTQNITKDYRTQGIMEKSQWDLKHIRMTRQLNRIDDFVITYQGNPPSDDHRIC
ncbi:hypothetical protein HELRODRAFT_164889 [Helobdella robusta]|uniref:Uncharacterized protein n=1 Tax=Helobdella robusta TaxID=6412 RepID=T1EVX3_HELRO|nr:hypothetical protein HELRODRAFT_164889 [Helobdella robusta]ESN92776.1 hypothetical protein HELRODRAFT_164889 [Helobdella robusta]